MNILDERDISRWAYYQCKNGNDIPEIRKLITKSDWAYAYCFIIKDRKEMWIK